MRTLGRSRPGRRVFDKTAWINETDGDYVDLISGRKMKAAGVNIPAFGYYYLKKC